MLAARLVAPGETLRLVEVAVPEPTGTEVRVRVAGCGVCRTDLHIVDGRQTRVEAPLTLGHEVAGHIDAVGPDAGDVLARLGLSIGDPILVYGGWGCGACRECRAGAEQRCPISRAPGFQSDGGYAEYLLVPHPRHLVALGSLDPVRAAPLADAGVTPYRAIRRAEPWLVEGARVLVIGCGALGQFALQYLGFLRGDRGSLRIVVVEPDAARRARALELGADAALASPADAREAVGGVADVALDFVGTDATLAEAARSIAPGGLIMLVGESGGRMEFGFDGPPVESWLTTAAWASRADLEQVVELAAGGRIEWTVETMPLGEAQHALERIRANDSVGRLVLVPTT